MLTVPPTIKSLTQCVMATFRAHLKNVFWPNIFVGASFQILNPPQADPGLRPTGRIRPEGESSYAGKLCSAEILNKNPIFEIGPN
jgi:hypothetical protein